MKVFGLFWECLGTQLNIQVYSWEVDMVLNWKSVLEKDDVGKGLCGLKGLLFFFFFFLSLLSSEIMLLQLIKIAELLCYAWLKEPILLTYLPWWVMIQKFCVDIKLSTHITDFFLLFFLLDWNFSYCIKNWVLPFLILK